MRTAQGFRIIIYSHTKKGETEFVAKKSKNASAYEKARLVAMLKELEVRLTHCVRSLFQDGSSSRLLFLRSRIFRFVFQFKILHRSALFAQGNRIVQCVLHA